MVEEENISLKDEIRQNREVTTRLLRLIESGQTKGVKLPKIPSVSQINKGHIYVLYIRENGVIDPMKVAISDLTTFIEGSPRFVMPEYLLSYKGSPAIIQPAWSIEPYDPRRDVENAERLRTIVVGRKAIINRLESGEIKGKKNLPGWIIFAGLAALAVVGYLLFK